MTPEVLNLLLSYFLYILRVIDVNLNMLLEYWVLICFVSTGILL